MARAKATDFLHNFRFFLKVTAIGAAGGDVTFPFGSPVSAGFSAVTVPEISEDAVEYREGHYIYTQKYSGIPTVGNVTLSRGVALTTTPFWDYMKSVIEGNAEYRIDFDIYHIHRDARQATSATGSVIMDPSVNAKVGYKLYSCSNAFPVRFKPSSDLDGTSSEVAIQEIELAVETISVTDGLKL